MTQSITVRISDEVHQGIQERSQHQGTRPSNVVRDGISLILKIDPDVLKSAQRLAAGYGTDAAEMISNSAIRVFAENQAYIDVYGGPLPNLFSSLFSRESDLDGNNRKVITGDQLYLSLKKGFIKGFENELERELEAQGRAVGGMEKLSEEDQLFLKKMAQRRAQRKASHIKKIEEESFKEV